jgi:hypothetical protein
VGSPTPPCYTQPPSRPDIPTKVCPDYPPPPDIPPMGADILAWNAREQFHSNFQKKTDVLFDEKIELVCIE